MNIYIGQQKSATILWLLLTIMSFVSFSNANAQCPTSCPPTPDCHADAWNGPEQTTYILCVGGRPCTITVQYCYRRACGVFNDVAVTCIAFSDPSCASNYTMAQIGEFAANAAFNHRYQQNDTNYTGIATCPSFTVSWRVYAASCWLNRDGNLLPCAGSGQCFATYKVCLDLMQYGCNDVPQQRIRSTRATVIASGNCPQWTPEATPCLEWCE
jgi:hypothetical protein